MSEIDEMLRASKRYESAFDKNGLPGPPGRKVAVLACMDARLNPYAILGLSEGDAHVIRNAGGVVSEDAIRSLAISQNLLGTEEIVLIHHTDCGMQKFTDEEVVDKLEVELGQRPEWPIHTFSDLDGDVREGIETIKASPFIPNTDSVRGFVYDVESGALTEVTS